MKNLFRSYLLLLWSALLLASCGGPASEPPKSSSSEESSDDNGKSSSSISSTASLIDEDSSDDSSESAFPSSSQGFVTSSESEEESFATSVNEETTITFTEEETYSSGEITFTEEDSSSETTFSSDESYISSSEVTGTPWANLDFGERGLSFLNTLADLIKSSGSRTVSYDGAKSILSKSDASPDDPNSVVPFYHPIDYPSGSWNREHVWPNSRGVGTSGPGSDPQMLRPTLTSDNDARHNYFYGPTDERVFDPAYFGYEPARGEAARIIFYTATRYAKSHGLSLTNNPNDATSANTMGILRNLVQWNRDYPVTRMEKLRNERLHEMGFARNPFIDFPAFADYIWNEDGLIPETQGDFEIIKDLASVTDGMKVLIVAEAADAAGSYASLDSTIYRDFYLTADVGTVSGDYYYPKGVYEEWTINIIDGVYRISSGDLILGVEVNDTHYNLVAKKGLATNNTWKPISLDATTHKMSLQNQGTNRYMEYYKGDFTCFNQDKGIYLYAR